MLAESTKKLIHRFRMIGIAEGISFLVLLLIAMPLKYIFKMPEAVKIVGWVHGALFLTFIYFAFEVMGACKKKNGLVCQSLCSRYYTMRHFCF